MAQHHCSEFCIKLQLDGDDAEECIDQALYESGLLAELDADLDGDAEHGSEQNQELRNGIENEIHASSSFAGTSQHDKSLSELETSANGKNVGRTHDHDGSNSDSSPSSVE